MGGASATAPKTARPEDQGAYRRLVEEHGRSVFRMAFRMTGNEQDAEDIVQETFLRAFRQFEHLAPGDWPGSWLHRIASNCAIDLLRRRKRWRLHTIDEENAAADAISPDRVVAGSEVRRRVSAALDRLTPKERVAFVLRHYEGLGIREISAITRASEAAVKNHVFRAVHKLRKVLAPLRGEV